MHLHAPHIKIINKLPVALFSMTGPHFGDRFGIAYELLSALEMKGVTPIGLNCSIASIKGIVRPEQIEPAIQAIGYGFDVPTIRRMG